MRRLIRIACLTVLFCFIWSLAVPASGSSGEREYASAPTANSSVEARALDPGTGNPGALEEPGEKKAAKKFPWLLASVGLVAVATLVLFFTGIELSSHFK